MLYLVWIITAFLAVGVGVYAASKVEKHEK